MFFYQKAVVFFYQKVQDTFIRKYRMFSSESTRCFLSESTRYFKHIVCDGLGLILDYVRCVNIYNTDTCKKGNTYTCISAWWSKIFISSKRYIQVMRITCYIRFNISLSCHIVQAVRLGSSHCILR